MRGEARFLNLAPGKYSVIAKPSGFTTTRTQRPGWRVIVPLSVTVSGVATPGNVQAETPVIETRSGHLDQRR
jgi:hypothetical protein